MANAELYEPIGLSEPVDLSEPVNETLNIIKDEVELNKLSYLSQKLYCIFDSKSLSFLPPFLANNDDEAIRNFTNALNYSNSTLNKFPADFRLLYIGEFIVSITGDTDKNLPLAEKVIDDYFIQIAEGKNCIQHDTDKFIDLIKRVDEAVQTSERVNNVLSTQLANVPNLNKEMDKANVMIKDLQSKFVKLDDYVTSKKIEQSRKSFLDKLFS